VLSEATSGVPAADVAFAWAAGAGAFLGVMAAGLVALRWLYRLVKAAEAIHADFMGEPARPGVPERPGVMVRMKSAEDWLRQLCQRLEGLERMVGQVLLDRGGEDPPATEGALLRRA
jgi:hypothetical protein